MILHSQSKNQTLDFNKKITIWELKYYINYGYYLLDLYHYSAELNKRSKFIRTDKFPQRSNYFLTYSKNRYFYLDDLLDIFESFELIKKFFYKKSINTFITIFEELYTTNTQPNYYELEDYIFQFVKTNKNKKIRIEKEFEKIPTIFDFME